MKPIYIITHHTAGSDLNPMQDSSNYTVAMCNRDHKARFEMYSSLGWYVGYQYFIDKDGVVTQCRKDDEEGAHTVGYNNISIGICLAGNFDLTDPTEKQKAALKNLITKKMFEYEIPIKNVVPHRKFASKTCHGKRLPDDWAQNLITVAAVIKETTAVVKPVMSRDQIKTEINRLVSLL